VFCPVCKRKRKRELEGIARQVKRNQDRVAFVDQLSKTQGLTGTSMQKQATAKAEQVIVDLFEDAAQGCGRAPADFALMCCGSMARREMVTFSDIDAVLVLSNNENETLEYFKGIVNTMASRLTFAGGHDTNFQFCPTGLSPKFFSNTIDVLIEQATDSNEGDHVRGALFTRLIYGNKLWAAAYQKACEKAIRTGDGHKAEALKQLRADLLRKNGDWKLPGADDLYVDVKSQIYRPAHMIVTEVGLYYNVRAEGTREVILGLVDKKKMSLQTANIFMQVLEDYARVTTAHQLSRGREEHWVRLRNVRPSDPKGEEVKTIPLAPAGQKKAIEEATARVKIIWNMAEEFVREKEKKKIFGTKRNPFTTRKPWEYA
jgi:signal-transduction protein with cAMP-binding, CBS, and nucleotidyltransferase domain